MSTDDTKSTQGNDDATNEKSNVLKLMKREECDDSPCDDSSCDDEDCPCCSVGVHDPGGVQDVSAEPILEVTERILDMLAALVQYRKGASKPEHPAVCATERALLGLLQVAASDLSEVHIGLGTVDDDDDDDDGDDE